jgi:hypothetical protein
MAFSTGSLFQLPNFTIPAPLGKGSSVRNIPAFQVLHSAFIKSSTSALASVVLDAVSTIFHSDPANYFILESQNTLNQFAEKIHLKGLDVQVFIGPSFIRNWLISVRLSIPGKVLSAVGVCRVPAELRPL